jgi:hypothetical protein
MEISNAAVGAITALCVTAGGAGVYVATGGHQPPSTPIETVVTAATPVQTFVPVQAAPAAPAARPARAAARPAVQRPAAIVRESRVEPSRFSAAAPVVEQTQTQQTRRSIWSPDAESEIVERDQVQRNEAAPAFLELTVPADAVVGLQLETALSSETAEIEDEVVARVTRDVRVGDRIAIPSGAQAVGQVTMVERGGRLRERARIGIRFTSAVLADGTRVPLLTDTITREGSSPGGESAAKIGGGAIGGAIIGGILGGTRGAVIGGSVGAGAGTTAVMVGGRNAATFPSGTPISARLVEPTTVTIDY